MEKRRHSEVTAFEAEEDKSEPASSSLPPPTPKLHMSSLCLILCCAVVLFAPITCCHFCVVSMVCKMLPGRVPPLVPLCDFLEESGLAETWLQDLFVWLD